MVKREQVKKIHNPEDFILVHKKAHAIVNCYMDSTIKPRIQINATPLTVDRIRTKVAKGDISYGLFHKAAMETFHILFPYWRKFCQYRYTGPTLYVVASRLEEPLKLIM
jgi:hypothetical protein